MQFAQVERVAVRSLFHLCVLTAISEPIGYRLFGLWGWWLIRSGMIGQCYTDYKRKPERFWCQNLAPSATDICF